MFVVLVEFSAHPGAEADLLSAIQRQAHNSLTREDACRRFDVCIDPDDPASIVLYELYDTPADFDAHRATSHFLDFDSAIKDFVAAKNVRTLSLLADKRAG